MSWVRLMRSCRRAHKRVASRGVSAMFWLKSCPRCRGDLCEGKDVYGRYVACLQCGHYLGEAEELLLRYLPRRGAEVRPGQVTRDQLTTAWAPADARALQVVA
jgi:hypothetical protein